MAKFFLTRRAGLDLLEVEEFSMEKWGEPQSGIYMSELYEAFDKISENPGIGKIRQHRAFPFYMAPAGSHFAIYKPFKDGVIIAKVVHGRQNIEAIIRRMSHKMASEIEEMERRYNEKE